MRRTAVALVAVFTVVLSGVAACGSEGRVARDEIVLRVVLADDWDGAPPVVEAVRTFEADHPGVHVQLQGLPFPQIPDTIRSGIDANEPHDVAQWHAFAAAAQELAEPIDDLWAERIDEDDYLPGSIVDVTWAGQRYGVPLDTNAMLLLSNPELAPQMPDIGPAPATFEEFRALAAAATTPDRSVRGTAVSASSWTTYGWIRANGGEVVTIADDGTVSFTLDAPAVVEALDFLGSLVGDQIAFPPLSRNVSTDAFALFQSGSIVFYTSGTWDVAALAGITAWEPRVDLLPRGRAPEGGSALGGSSLFVPRGAENRDLALEFMLHLTGDDVALDLARQEGRLPAQVAVFEDRFFDTPAYRVVREQLQVAHPMLLIAFPAAAQAFAEATEDVLTGRATAAEALGRAQEIAEASVASSP